MVGGSWGGVGLRGGGGGQVNSALDALRRLTASKPYNTYIKIINILYICWNELTLRIYIKNEFILRVS